MAIDVWTESSMKRIFPHGRVPRRGPRTPRLDAARNEVEAFQIGIHGDPAGLNDIRATPSDLAAEDGRRIDAEQVEVLFAEYVPVHWHSPGNTPDDLEGEAPGFYPDPLLPTLWRDVSRVQFPETISAWVRVRVPGDAEPGRYTGNVRVECAAGAVDVPFELNVWPFALPDESHFLMTNWFSVSLVMKFHRLEPLTPEFWDVLALYAKNLADHRQNVILTPLFRIGGTGQVLDGRTQDTLIDITEPEPDRYAFDFTNLDRWVELFFAHRFQLIEGSHLAGGSRSPAGICVRHGDRVERRSFPSTMDEGYRTFLGQFLTALRDHLGERGWLDRFVLHLSDEPRGDQFEPYTSLATFVKEKAPEFRLIDAMGHGEYAPYVDHPVPLESVYERFVAESGIPQEQIWFYYCCGPTGPWPNRFLDYPLVRVRIFTWLAFRYGIPGFLHWGLNHWGWHRPYYRAEEYNPYDNTTGGTLQAGDSYVLYPPRMPSESHEPVDSIRWEIIRKAMEDYEYLYLLRGVADGEGREAAAAKGLLRELEEEIAPDFVGHTRDPRLLDRFRRRAGRLLARAL